MRATKKGQQRVLTLLELAQIHGAQGVQGALLEEGLISPIDRNVDGQTGSTFPWEGGMEGLNTVNGNKLTALPLVNWQGRGGLNVVLVLYHNSQAEGASEVGQRWTHSYSIYGVVDPDLGDFSVRWGDGLGYKFTQNIDGSFTAPQGISDTLAKDSTGYTLTTKNQVRYRFEGGTGNRRNAIWMKDRSNNQVTIVHNSSDAVTSVTDPTGRTLSFAYASGKLTSVTDPAGRVFTMARNGSGDLVSIGFPLSTSVSYGYDSSHRITSTIDARGKIWTQGYTAFGALAWEKNPLNQQTSYTYGAGYVERIDPQGRATRHNYGSGGELVAVVEPGNRTTAFAYSNYRPTSAISPGGATNYVTYDSAGNVLTSTDPLGYVATYSYNAKNDLVSVTTPMGKVVTNAYDSMGRLIRTSDPLGHTTSYTLNSYGLVIATTNVLGKMETVTYDGNGYPISMTDPLGHTKNATYSVLGLPLTISDATGKTVTNAYDSLGRLTSVTAPGGRTESYTYDGVGNKLTTSNPMGQVNSFLYDDAGRLLRHTDPLGRIVSFGYNAAGQKTSFTDGRGKTTTYSYNSDGFPSGMTYPDGTSCSQTYNTEGQLATSTDGRGVITTNAYNIGGQLMGVSYSDGTPSVGFTYDPDGAKISMTDGTGITNYSYDGAGRITARTTPQGAVTYTWNNTNQLIGKIGGGSTLFYSYDDSGRMISQVAGGNQTTNYGYDNADRLTSTTLPNGSVETRTYSVAMDLASIVSTKQGATITSSIYSYDARGRKLSETTPSYTIAYTYDNAGQLINENRTGNAAYTIGYSYDNAGNRLTKTVNSIMESYAYDNANKLLSAGGKSYSYDSAGNLIGVSGGNNGSTTLTWDGESRLLSATSGTSTVNYTYNGLGQRVGKSGGVSRSYVLTDDMIDTEVLSDGAASFIHGATGLLSEKRGGTNKFYHTDALGSVRALTDTNGNITDVRGTDAFGMGITSSGSTPTPFGFAGSYGYQQDSETGLQAVGHRMYDASTGRFISRDPIQDGHNWYVYCENDPINNIDPEGLAKIIITITGVINDPHASRPIYIGTMIFYGDDGSVIMKTPIRTGGHGNGMIPYGKYMISELPRTSGNPKGTGGMFTPLEPVFKTPRTAIGVHHDGNYPGTQGCVGIQDFGDYKEFVKQMGYVDPKKHAVPVYVLPGRNTELPKDKPKSGNVPRKKSKKKE